MNAVSSINSLPTDAYLSPATSSAPPAATAGSPPNESVPVDHVDLSSASPTAQDTSETGRIALNLAAGNLTSDQATDLYQQVASIQSQIAADKQANGGTLSTQDAQTIDQLQSQLSGTIYSDAHNDAAPPTTAPNASEAGKRAAMQAGRIESNEQDGNISASQAQTLTQQQTQIDQQIASDEQANNGTLTKAQAQQINQLQDQASQAINQAQSVSPAAQ